MKNKIAGMLLVIILVFVNSKGLIYAKETPDELKNLYARSAVLMDAESGRILFGKNEMNVLPMASTTKIMTCIITLECMKDQQIGSVSEYASKQPKVHLGIKKGERYYLKDLLYSLMLESHNDSAVVIAEAIGGTVEGFAKMMNQKAREIGCKNTYFITPNGLDARDETGVHATTATDLALIMSYCIQNSPKKEEFLQITQTKKYCFTDIEKNRSFNCYNHNSFLGMMKEAISGKTGYTNDAGYCYVGAVRDGDRTFVVALLACGWPNNKGYKWKDTRKLMNYALDNYKYQNMSENIKTNEILVKDGVDPSDYLNRYVLAKTTFANENQVIRVLLCEEEKVEVKVIQKEMIHAPVRKGQVTGTVYYLLNDKIIAEKDIILECDIDEVNMRGFLFGMIKDFCL